MGEYCTEDYQQVIILSTPANGTSVAQEFRQDIIRLHQQMATEYKYLRRGRIYNKLK